MPVRCGVYHWSGVCRVELDCSSSQLTKITAVSDWVLWCLCVLVFITGVECISWGCCEHIDTVCCSVAVCLVSTAQNHCQARSSSSRSSNSSSSSDRSSSSPPVVYYLLTFALVKLSLSFTAFRYSYCIISAALVDYWYFCHITCQMAVTHCVLYCHKVVTSAAADLFLFVANFWILVLFPVVRLLFSLYSIFLKTICSL